MLKVAGKALKEAREKKDWTQARLSEATKPKVDVSTISRIERDKPTRIRENTLRALAKALDVQPKDLQPEAETRGVRGVMKITIDDAARNALTLVAIRYQISCEEIVEAAPFLFFIAAELSLKERQRRITDISAAAKALFALQRAVWHLPPRYPVDEDAMLREEQSIEARDIFGTKVRDDAQRFISEFDDDFDEAEQNPFVQFLRDNLSKVIGSNEAADRVRWPPGLSPSYEICAEEAGSLVGNDAKATRAILAGSAALHEIPKGTPQQRAEWARTEFDRKDIHLDDLLVDLIGPPRIDVETSKSGEASS